MKKLKHKTKVRKHKTRKEMKSSFFKNIFNFLLFAPLVLGLFLLSSSQIAAGFIH